MTEKVTIKPDQVVSRKGGYISYYDAGSTLRKAKVESVIVLGEGQEPPKVDLTQSPTTANLPPVEQTTTAGPSDPVDTPPPDPQSDPQPTKPSKRGRSKPKETADMASKTGNKKAPKKEKAARTAKPKAPREGGSVRTIGGKPVDISRYEKAKAPGGGTSYNNGDAVAERLQGKDLEAVYEIVAKALKCEVKELKSKYKHLNVGMQRMNLGNRLRKVAIPREAKA